MKVSKSLLAAALAATTVSFAAVAEEGVARVGEGVVDAVSAPANIPQQMAKDIEETDPVTGTVTGAVKGGASAAGQVVEGAAKVGVGAVEAITAPLTGGN